MNTEKKHLGLRSLALIVVIAILMFGGISITGVAAQTAIPGDALYLIKTSIEQTRLSLAQDAGERALMRIGFAEHRLKELAALIEEGRYHEVSAAVLAFEADIHSAILELEIISKIDPARGTQIALAITEALTRYAQTLSTMAANAPQSVMTEVSRALDTTQIASGLELPPAGLGSDDNSNANANTNVNDNANINGNDDNANFNGFDDDANGNVNDDNVNFNGVDDNANFNGNDNNANSNNNDDNANSNRNDDNANSNRNDNDDNSNTSNDNDDDNQNGNSNSNDDSGNNNGDGSGGGDSDDNSNNRGSGGSGGNDNDQDNGDD